MKLEKLMAFRCMDAPRHIYVALFDENRAGDDMVLVNFTTLRDTCIDSACILTPADYGELTHETTVAYSRAMLGKKSLMEHAITAGHFVRLADIPLATWLRIVASAHNSNELSSKYKIILPR